ncbi:MAG TPA: metallophosphoesterase [Myxococcales bacterium]|nr:metallophosphoesterase [Myxococcales bacterium]
MGPWLLDPGASEITIAWTTAQPVLGRVWYLADRLAQEEAPRTDHRVTLRSLPDDGDVRYRIEGAPDVEGTFHTAPLPHAPFRVVVYGNNRTNGGDHALVARAAAAERAQLAIHTGDMVINAADEQLWSRWFFEETDLLRHTPLITTVGNHEITDDGVAYARYFANASRPRYHSLDYGPLHLVVLDAYERGAGADPHQAAMTDAQLAWVEEDLRGVPADKHVWIVVHQGPFAHPEHMRPGHGGNERVRLAIQAAARRHPVEAVFSGHEPFYERGEVDGLRYFVVGGGGAPLEDPDPTFPTVQSAHKALSFVSLQVCGCHVTGQAKDIAGRVLDSFTLSDCAEPCGTPVAAKGRTP